MATVNHNLHTSCNTGTCMALSLQIIAEMNRLLPGLLLPVAHERLKAESRVNLFLQRPARDSLYRVLDAANRSMTVISMYRVLPQQVMLRAWYEAKRCGIPLAALPGTSNHEDAAAIDVASYDYWKPRLRAHGWRWLGPQDRAHFDYRGSGIRGDVGRIGVKAFQVLWNTYNPDDRLTIDGVFGPETRRRLLRSPADGWPEKDE